MIASLMNGGGGSSEAPVEPASSAMATKQEAQEEWGAREQHGQGSRASCKSAPPDGALSRLPTTATPGLMNGSGPPPPPPPPVPSALLAAPAWSGQALTQGSGQSLSGQQSVKLSGKQSVSEGSLPKLLILDV